MSFLGSLWNGIKTVAKTVAAKAVKVVGNALTKVAEFGEKVIKPVSDIAPRVGAWLNGICDKLKNTGERWTNWAEKIEKDMAAQKEAAAAREAERERDRKKIEFLTNANWANRLVEKIRDRIKKFPFLNMEDFLQTRAVLKVLEYMKEYRFNPNRKIREEDVSTEKFCEDKIFLNISEKLLGAKSITEQEADEFGNLFKKIFRKEILSQIFEDMVQLWAADLEKDRIDEEKAKDELRKIRTMLNRYETRKKHNLLDESEKTELESIRIDFCEKQEITESLERKIGHRQYYIEAAEGMLLVYNDDDSALFEAIKHIEGVSEYTIAALKESSMDVANVILRCMEGGIEWELLTDTEQSLIREFSNIFRLSAEKRAKPIIDVVVGVS